ncbi:MAG: VTC domain-containing protein, partial [Gammaproteobacteria bacterium]
MLTTKSTYRKLFGFAFLLLFASGAMAEDCYRGTLDKHAVRAKLRIRTYRHASMPAGDRPAFFEIKRKVHGVIFKTRAKVVIKEYFP